MCRGMTGMSNFSNSVHFYIRNLGDKIKEQ